MNPRHAFSLSLFIQVGLMGCSSSEPPASSNAVGAAGAEGAGETADTGGSPGTRGIALQLGSSGAADAGLPVLTEGGSTGCDAIDPDGDHDQDGFTIGHGDCNDCDPYTNPGAYDVVGNDIDEDCNGKADDEPTGCDTGLPIEGDDPSDGARAIDICRKQNGNSWGLVSAQWVFPDGSSTSVNQSLRYTNPAPSQPAALSRGILPSFGTHVRPRMGAGMLALSSGVARSGVNQSDGGLSPSGAVMGTISATPPGFPKDSPACPGVRTANDHMANDGIALELTIKVPTNATALAYNLDFYTYEWPAFVCTEFNDFFVALLDSKSETIPPDKNISFDSEGNSISVNAVFVEVCPKLAPEATEGRNYPCRSGTAELEGTGFDETGFSQVDFTGTKIGGIDLDELQQQDTEHAATSWLETKVGVVPGETIILRFAIWDMGDSLLDSTILLDNFRWTVLSGTKHGEALTPPSDPVEPETTPLF